MAGAFSTAYSSAFDVAVPSSDICYPSGTDWSCVGTAEDISQLDPVAKVRAEALAWSTLSALTGYRVSLCPITIRPCAARCNPQTWYTAPVWGDGAGATGVWGPYISGGTWYNACGCAGPSDCSCSNVSELIFPAEIGGIESVTLDGAVLDPSAYRVDNGIRLVRQDGGIWPTCQDMGKPLEDAPEFEPFEAVFTDGSIVVFSRKGDTVTADVRLVTGSDDGPDNIPEEFWPAATGSLGFYTEPYAKPGTFGMFVDNYPNSALFVAISTFGSGPFGTATFQWEAAPVAHVGQSGTLAVSYYPGVAPNDILRYAAGVLANEFYLACVGKDCRLPNGVTGITRAGITLEIPEASFTNGSTGIPEVDAVIRIYNPFGIKARPRVMSPDRSRGRTQTWGA